MTFCNYIDAAVGQDLMRQYSTILASVGRFIQNADLWGVSS
ncbi:MAG TPA: hypothetical protein ACFE0H_08565 [Elainellaceae cyanobacterium]